MDVFSYIIPILIGIVAIVLFAGLWNMMRGGSPSFSQKMMRWRVGLQFLAIIVMMGALYFAQTGS